jgi:membrane associated rhomboid family serine protease
MVESSISTSDSSSYANIQIRRPRHEENSLYLADIENQYSIDSESISDSNYSPNSFISDLTECNSPVRRNIQIPNAQPIFRVEAENPELFDDVTYYTFSTNSLISYYNLDDDNERYVYKYFILLVWLSYIIGLFFLDKIRFDQISPSVDSLFYGIVSYYPYCEDRRLEVWRFFTNSIVHSGIIHIISNTVLLGPIMYLVESSYNYKIVITIFGLVSFYCGLSFSYFMPYSKVIGCSHLVFAYTGSLLADYIINFRHMDSLLRKVLLSLIFLIIFFECISFFFLKIDNVAYLFHWLGFIYGFIIGLIFMWDKRTNKSNIRYLLIGTNILAMLSMFFVHSYITNWTPENVNFLGFNSLNSCCYQLFHYNQTQNNCFI